MRIAGITLPPLLQGAFEQCRPHLAAAAGFSVLISVLLLAPAIYMLQVYDRVLTTGGKATLLFVTLGLAVALLTLAALDAVRSRLLVRASAQIDATLAPEFLSQMLRSGARPSVQAMRDLDVVRQTLASPAAAALFDLPWAPIFIIVCFLLHFWLGVLGFAAIVVLLLIAGRHQRATAETTEASSRSIATSHLAEQAAAAHAGTLRALGMVGAMADRHRRQRAAGIGSLVQTQLVGSRFTALSRFVRLFVQSAALGLGALLAVDGRISPGAVIAASILIGRALQPIDALIGGWSSLMNSRAALVRLAEASEGLTGETHARTALPKPLGRIDAEHVGVQGSGSQPILSGVSFSLAAGEFAGLIGPSGSGKTTLAKAIVGAALPDVGVVRIDGAKLADWDQDDLGKHIGYLPQEPSLFEGTIKENISRFRLPLEADEDIDSQVIAAAQLAEVHDMILRLPTGYDTPLGPGGTGLSAGQSQRIALARALYGDPAVLVLDEPNAFLDFDGESALDRAIQAARARRATILVVAHRKSVLQKADRLLVLENGRLRVLGLSDEPTLRRSGSSGGQA